MNPSRRLVKIALVLMIVIGFIVLESQVELLPRRDVEETFAGLGWIRVPAFVGFYALATLLPLPKAVCTIAGGALFGFALGTILVLTGAIVGSSAAFALARTLGRERLRGVAASRVVQLDAQIGKRGFAAVLVARLIPLVPFTTINYVFGLTSVSFGTYFVATAIGIVPGTAVYAAVGAYGFEPGSWPFIIAVFGLVVLSAAGVIRSRLQRRRGVTGQKTDDGSLGAP